MAVVIAMRPTIATGAIWAHQLVPYTFAHHRGVWCLSKACDFVALHRSTLCSVAGVESILMR